MTKVRVGVVGVGYLGQFHAEKYASNPDVELTAIVDPDIDRATLIAEKLRTRALVDPAQLMGMVDAVSIVAPTVLHYRLAKQFLEKGVHVLLEKPITTSTTEADELITLSNTMKTILQVGHIERFNPAIASVKKALRSPRYMIAERTAPFTVRCTDVNVVLDLMIHDLDIVLDLAGSMPKEVSAAGFSLITREIDIASARIIFQNGCIADVMASRVSDEKKRLLKVFDGNVMYQADFQTQRSVMWQRKEGDGIPELNMTEVSSARRDTLGDEIAAFVHCVKSGERPLVTGVEGKRALVFAKMITEAIENGITGFVSL